MRHDEYQDGSVLDRLADIWYRGDVLGKLNSGKVFSVLMLIVDDLGQFFALKLRSSVS